ncbi:unnamed protein product [Leptidea sinapis]|uniref:Uncharacterized protein n=1 Tax=Leptidea sinapis TaxID=189913 RepID=A0A5E4PZT7_9NEOP|nr:unnamed protein product [Leptidea sinapis]
MYYFSSSKCSVFCNLFALPAVFYSAVL